MRKIVISGSMSLLDKMKDMAAQLADMGYATVLPEAFDGDIPPKAELSMNYFREIAKDDTYAVLIVNDAKQGIANYIGASAFAEAAIAFYFGKAIFVLHDLYDPYKDELSAWGTIPLYGKLRGIYLG